MKKKYALAAVSLLVAFLPASGGALSLDADTAVRIALENNLDLQSTRIDLQTAARNRENAWNQYLPAVSASASLIRSNEAPTTAAGEMSPWNINFSARASLSLTSAAIYSTRGTLLDYQAGLITFETAEKRLERDVRKAFYSLILARESIELAEMELATAVSNYEQTLKNYEAGLLPRLQVLSAQVAAENLGPALESKKLSYTTGLMGFKTLIGLDSEEDIILEGSIDSDVYGFNGRELSSRFVENRLDIQALSKTIETLENTRKIQTLSGLSPTLSLSASWSPGLNDPFASGWFGAGAWSDSGQIALSVSVPLSGFIPGSSTRTQLAAIDDSIEKARLSLGQARRQGKNEIESIALQLDKSLRSIRALEMNVSLAQEAYDLTEEAYKAGTEQLLAVQGASDDLQEAKLALLQEKYNYLCGLLDLEYALNTTLNEVKESHE
jgi:outer membrane protein TolC